MPLIEIDGQQIEIDKPIDTLTQEDLVDLRTQLGGTEPSIDTSPTAIGQSFLDSFLKPEGLLRFTPGGPALSLVGKGTEAFQGAVAAPTGERLEGVKRGLVGEQTTGQQLIEALGLQSSAERTQEAEDILPGLGALRDIFTLKVPGTTEGLLSPETVAELGVDPFVVSGIGGAATKAVRTGRKAGLAAEKIAFEAPDVVGEFLGKQGTELLKARKIPQRVDTLLGRGGALRSELGEKIFTGAKTQGTAKKLQKVQSDLSNIFDSREFNVTSEAIEKFGSPTIRVGGKDIPLSQQIISTRGVVVNPDTAQILNKLSDIPVKETKITSLTDATRVAERLDGSFRGPVKRSILEPIERALVAESDELNTISKGLNDAVNNAKYNPKDVEKNSLLFRVAEGRASPEDLTKLTKEDQELIAFTRGKYDEFIKRINQSRKASNIREIEPLSNYVTHIKRLSIAEELGINLAKAQDPRITQFLQKLKPTFRFEKKRIGGAFDENLVDAFEAYYPSALRSIHRTQPTAVARAHADFLPDNARVFFNQWINETVLGKETSIDRDFSSIKPFTRMFTNITSRGAILGNLSTTALQPSTAGITTSLTNIRSSVMGLRAALSSEGTDLFKALSNQGKLRSVELDLDIKTLKSVEKAAGWLMETLDRFMVKHAWLSGFHQAKNQLGWSDAAAIKYGDTIAAKSQAIYNKVFTPQIQRSSVAKAAAGQFQSFIFNLWNSLTRDIGTRAKVFGKVDAAVTLGKMVVGMYGTNLIYQGLGLPEPFDNPVPFLSSAKFGPPILFRGIRGVGFIAAGATTGDLRLIDQGITELKKTAPVLVPGGNQLRKTIQGAQAVNQGFTKLGRKKVPIEGLGEQIRAVAFGPFGTKAAKEEFKKREEKSNQRLLEKGTGFIKDLLGR